jgi:hypothetical protein
VTISARLARVPVQADRPREEHVND